MKIMLKQNSKFILLKSDTPYSPPAMSKIVSLSFIYKDDFDIK